MATPIISADTDVNFIAILCRVAPASRSSQVAWRANEGWQAKRPIHSGSQSTKLYAKILNGLQG
jgi:hypothetical protein